MKLLCVRSFSMCKNKDMYWRTSRIAAIRAGVENEEDIRYVGNMKFSGSLFEQLEERLGLSAYP